MSPNGEIQSPREHRKCYPIHCLATSVLERVITGQAFYLLVELQAQEERMTPHEEAALERLLAVAARDMRQSRKVADFLLAWWNASDCGGFDPTVMWDCESAVVEDMLVVFRMIGHNHEYPDQIGYRSRFKTIVRFWRPELVDG